MFVFILDEKITVNFVLFIADIPELRSVIGEVNVGNLLSSDEANLHENLRECFRALMVCPDELVAKALDNLLVSLSNLGN